MDEDVGVRLTRSRRRQSVEQNEEVTTSAPSTPTKRRATKLAKPQLDDIVENAVVDSPKRNTRRSMVPEVSGSVDETRTATPAVHVARSRSNNSILSESTLAAESPRNKRATRRNSLAGSDTESASVSTPARRSRRISKEFTKSPDTSGEAKIPGKINSKKSTSKTKEAIVEENEKEDVTIGLNSVNEDDVPSSNSQTSPLMSVEKEAQHLNSASDKNSPTSLRKSPRLSIKKNKTSPCSLDNGELKAHENIQKAEQNNSVSPTKKTKTSSLNIINSSFPIIVDNNKSVSNKRFRTKSLTNFDKKSSFNDTISFFSDNESRPVQSSKKKKDTDPQLAVMRGTGDHKQSIEINMSKSSATTFKVEENKENEIQEVSCDDSFQVDSKIDFHKRNRNPSGSLPANISGIVELDITTQTKDNDIITDETKNAISKQQCNVDEINDASKIYSTVIMDDSDTSEVRVSESNKIRKNNKMKKKSMNIAADMMTDLLSDNIMKNESGLEKKNKKIQDFEKKNEEKISETSNDISNKNIDTVNVFMSNNVSVFDNTCEPMDVDETIPENVEIQASNFKKTYKNNSHRSDKECNTLQKSAQICNNEIQSPESCDVEKGNNANKSTLILSINKSGNLSAQSTSKSNKNETNKETPKSKSFELKIKKGLHNSAAPITSATPLRHKIAQNAGVYTSTPVPTLIDEKQKDGSFHEPKPEISGRSKTLLDDNSNIDSGSSDEDKGSGLEDDEAEDAGNDYESGDSQDEEEREYAKQNEIPIGGETLESDSTESDDTDYEKDSFLVSSAEEDHDLLNGSGDDLCFSDNDLKMTPKSKMKYDERKTKEQKRASREMYESRHGKNTTMLSDESEDVEVIISSKNRKRNRLRLDSSKDTSNANVNQEETEISIIGNNSISGKDPLSVTIKQEVLEISGTNNTTLKPIENVDINQDVTMFANEESVNPLTSFIDPDDGSISESSEDGGIADNYSSLLQNLNTSNNKRQQDATRLNKSVDDAERKSKKKKCEPILEILNITQEKNNNSSPSNALVCSANHINLKNEGKKITIGTPLKFLDNIEPKAAETSQSKLIKQRKNLSLTEYKESKNKMDSSLLDKLNLTSSGKEKKKKKKDRNQETVHNDNDGSVQNNNDDNKKDSSVLDKLNLTSSGKEKKKKKKDRNQETVHNDSDGSVQSNNDDEALVASATCEQVNIKDSKPKAVKHDNSYTDQSKNEKDGFLKDETSGSGKPLKSKKIKKQEARQPAQPSADKSSDSINFKLLFMSEEDSNDEPSIAVTTVHPGLHEEKAYPLKKSAAKTNLLESSSSSLKAGTNVDLHATKTLEKKKGKIFSDIQHNGKEVTVSMESTQQVSSKKRKDRDNDISITNNKVFKTSSENKFSVQRLPSSILEKLEHQPQKLSEDRTKIVTATSTFRVEPVRRRGTKPSLYLEESIHIDSMTAGPSQDKTQKKSKLLRSIPTPSTSNVGFTTNFMVNVLKQEKRQDAKVTGPFGDFVNFKTERLYGPTIKRIATDDLCRKQKRLKTTRF